MQPVRVFAMLLPLIPERESARARARERVVRGRFADFLQVCDRVADLMSLTSYQDLSGTH